MQVEAQYCAHRVCQVTICKEGFVPMSVALENTRAHRYASCKEVHSCKIAFTLYRVFLLQLLSSQVQFAWCTIIMYIIRSWIWMYLLQGPGVLCDKCHDSCIECKGPGALNCTVCPASFSIYVNEGRCVQCCHSKLEDYTECCDCNEVIGNTQYQRHTLYY